MKCSLFVVSCTALAMSGAALAQSADGGSGGPTSQPRASSTGTTSWHDGGGSRDGGWTASGERSHEDGDRNDGGTWRDGRHEGAFDRLSPGGQKIALRLYRAQTRDPDGHALTLNQIAALKDHEGWGQVFHSMKAQGLTDARNLGQVVSGHYRVSTTHHHYHSTVTDAGNHSSFADWHRGDGTRHGDERSGRGGERWGSRDEYGEHGTSHHDYGEHRAETSGAGSAAELGISSAGGHWHGGASHGRGHESGVATSATGATVSVSATSGAAAAGGWRGGSHSHGHGRAR